MTVELPQHPVGWRSISAIIAIQLALTTFLNLVVFPSHVLRPVATATGGLVNETLLANLAMMLVLGAAVFGRGMTTARDLGLVARQIPSAIGWTVFALVLVNLGEFAATLQTGGGPVLNEALTDRPLRVAGDFGGQIFGNALLEESLFRGFLVAQTAALLARRKGTALTGRDWMLAVAMSQVVFALVHIPNRVGAGLYLAPSDVVKDLTLLWVMGMGFAGLWMASGNLFVAIGVHSVMNDPIMLLRPDHGPGGQVALLTLVVIVVMNRVRRRGPVNDRR